MSDKPKTFSIPLVGPKKNFAAPNCTFDHAAIGKIYRERLGGNPFGIKPDSLSQPELPLDQDG